jgi:hypothetical protein
MQESKEEILADISRILKEGERDGSIHSYPARPTTPPQQLPEGEKARTFKEDHPKNPTT